MGTSCAWSAPPWEHHVNHEMGGGLPVRLCTGAKEGLLRGGTRVQGTCLSPEPGHAQACVTTDGHVGPSPPGRTRYGGSVLLFAPMGAHHVDRTPHRAQGNRRRRGGSRARGTVPGPRRRARAAALGAPAFRALRALPDERDGVVRLHLPEGFRYRSFHDTDDAGRPRRRHACCRAATTAWPPSRARTGGSRSCATTRSTGPARPSAPSVTTPTTRWRRAGAPSSTPRSPVRSRRPGPASTARR